MATSISREDLIRQHTVGISLIKEDLAENVAKLVKKEELLALFDKDLTDKLTDHGKTIFSAGLNEEGLNTVENEIKKEFRKHYSTTLTTAESQLRLRNNPKIVAKEAENRFKQRLENVNTKEKLFQFFISQLAAKGQSFTEEDKPHLRNAFFQYMDKTIEKHSDSLKDFQSLESVKARMQLNDDNTTQKSNATMTAQAMTKKGLITGHKVDPTVGYKIDIDNLRQQLKYGLASLKPGEKINIDVSMPDRAEIVKRMAETGFQYRTPLLALLLLLFLQLKMINKDDTTRVLKAVKDLAKKVGLTLDPTDINLKLSVRGNDGKKQTLSEGPLPEPLVNQLNASIAQINTQILPPRPSFSKRSDPEEDGRNEEYSRMANRVPSHA